MLTAVSLVSSVVQMVEAARNHSARRTGDDPAWTGAIIMADALIFGSCCMQLLIEHELGLVC